MRRYGFPLAGAGAAVLLFLVLLGTANPPSEADGRRMPAWTAAFDDPISASAPEQATGTPDAELPPESTVPLSLAALYDPAYAGFDWGLPVGLAIEPLAGGIAPAVADGPGVLQLDRVVLAPGEDIDVSQASGPLLLFVESGTLTFIDELGLEAQAVQGAQQFLGDGAAYHVRNDATDQARLLWLRYVPQSTGSGAGDTGGPVFTVQTVRLFDGGVSPGSLTIPAGVPVAIQLENTGSSVHSFSIDALNLYSGDITPGGSQQITLTAPVGTYQFYDGQTGVTGTLVAAAAGSTGATATAEAEASPVPTSVLGTPPETLFASGVPAPPASPVLLFLMRVRLDPGADFGEQTLTGPVGLVAETGTTTISRPGRLPAQLQPGQRAGRVVFPANYTSREQNVGSEPATILVAGLVTANQALLVPAGEEEVTIDEGDDTFPEEASPEAS